MCRWIVRLAPLALLLALSPLSAQTQDLGALALDRASRVTVPALTVGRLAYANEVPGLLVVAVRGGQGGVTMDVRDADGMPLLGGDMGEGYGAEQMVVPLPWADTWRVALTNILDDDAEVSVLAHFIPYAEVAQEPDPDRRPSLATDLAVPWRTQNTLDPTGGDHTDWYRFTPAADGLLALFTRGQADNEGAPLDLAMRVMTGGSYEEQVAFSDSDAGGEYASEGVVVPVHAGQVYYVQITGYSGAGRYELAARAVAFE